MWLGSTLFLSKKKKRSGGAISCIPQPVYAFMGAILIECDVSCLHCIRGAVVLLLHGEALRLACSAGALQDEMTKV